LPLTQALKIRHVEPGAKTPAFAGHHNHPNARIRSQSISGLAERREHRGVEGVHLAGATQEELGNTVIGDL
jgi:hypothetical protein